ncbi:MAG: O-antigen ligase family protein [Patescibacteria group bacterium]
MKLIRYIFLIFVFSLPLTTKKFLFSFSVPFSNVYTSEHNSAFLYGTDILLLLLIILSSIWLWKNRGYVFDKTHALLIVFLVISFGTIFVAAQQQIAFYSFLRLFASAIGAVLIGFILNSGIVRFADILKAVSASAVLQSIISFFQFTTQGSLGMWFLGETVIREGIQGVARIGVNGVGFIRAYGTMPHANILAGFLVLGLVSLFYLFINNNRFIWKAIYAAGIFSVLTALALTFSRSGWIVAGVSTLLCFVWGMFQKQYRKDTLRLIGVVVVCSSFLFITLGWAIFSRTHLSVNEGSVKDRISYNRMGVEIIRTNPIGVGIGNELFFAFQEKLFDRFGVGKNSQLQPIHNIYLLIASEVGVAGLLLFLIFVFTTTLRGFDPRNIEFVFSFILLISLLVFGLFDHFLWDLQAGRLMLWLVLGIMMGQARVQPS